MKIVTFNLRCVYDRWDGVNSLIHRAGFIYEKINAEKPDVIAFQELVEKSLELFTKLFPEYLFLGHFREADYSGEGVFTAVRKDKIEVLGFEDFWLSPTPYVPGSKFENQGVFPRTCLMTQLRYRETGTVFRVYNIHLDYESDDSRQKGIACVLDAFEANNKKSDLPSIILGDFNASPFDDVIKKCNETPKILDVTKNIQVTFHDYGRSDTKIDYIFITRDMEDNLKNVCAWTDKCVWHPDLYHGPDVPYIYLSDHYPVCAELDI